MSGKAINSYAVQRQKDLNNSAGWFSPDNTGGLPQLKPPAAVQKFKIGRSCVCAVFLERIFKLCQTRHSGCICIVDHTESK